MRLRWHADTICCLQALPEQEKPWQQSEMCIRDRHGPVLKENLGYYIEKYQIWSSYEPEDEGILIAYASIHGNTKQAAEKMRDILIEKGAKNVVIMDLSRDCLLYTSRCV